MGKNMSSLKVCGLIMNAICTEMIQYQAMWLSVIKKL